MVFPAALEIDCSTLPVHIIFSKIKIKKLVHVLGLIQIPKTGKHCNHFYIADYLSANSPTVNGSGCHFESQIFIAIRALLRAILFVNAKQDSILHCCVS